MLWHMEPEHWIALVAVVVGAGVSVFTMVWQTRAERKRTEVAATLETQRAGAAVRHELYIRVIRASYEYLTAAEGSSKGLTSDKRQAALERTMEMPVLWGTLCAEVSVVGPGFVVDLMMEFGARLMQADRLGWTAESVEELQVVENYLHLAMRADLAGLDLAELEVAYHKSPSTPPSQYLF